MSDQQTGTVASAAPAPTDPPKQPAKKAASKRAAKQTVAKKTAASPTRHASVPSRPLTSAELLDGVTLTREHLDRTILREYDLAVKHEGLLQEAMAEREKLVATERGLGGTPPPSPLEVRRSASAAPAPAKQAATSKSAGNPPPSTPSQPTGRGRLLLDKIKMAPHHILNDRN
jgi:hypothetical protein